MKFDTGHSVEELAEYIDAKLIGSKSNEVTGINEIHKVDPGDITFVDFYKYYDKALTSDATTIIINKEVDCPEGKTLLVSKDPFRDYNRLVNRFCPYRRKIPLFDRSTYFIDDSAQVGADTTIMPGCYIGSDVKIGKDCKIWPNVVLHDGVIIGNHVEIQSNTTIGGHAFYYKFREDFDPPRYDQLHTCGNVVIEDYVEIGCGCTIDKGVSGITRIGEGSKLDNQVMIGHGVVLGKNCLIAAHVGIAGKTVLGDKVILWGQVGVNKGLKLGDHCIVLGKSGVGHDLEAGKVYFGSPAIEAKAKWKEIATMRKLPEMWNVVKEQL